MTKEEYKATIKLIEDKYKSDILSVKRDYALANNYYKEGDTLTDRGGTTVVVDKIGVYLMFSDYTNSYPECYYEGFELTKKGVPFKDGRRAAIYQSNII